MATELVLIRHGHAVRVNNDYVLAPLTDLGRRQAELTGLRLCDEAVHFDGYYASPLRRTRETSALIGSKIAQIPAIQNGIQELEGIEVPSLVLMEFLAHLGLFGSYLYVNSGKAVHWPIMGRVSRVVTDVLKKHTGGRVGIVTHSGVISSILAWYFPDKRRRWWRYVVDNCSLTIFRIDGTKIELVTVNDTKHLSDALTTKQPPAGTIQVVSKVEETVNGDGAAEKADVAPMPKSDKGKANEVPALEKVQEKVNEGATLKKEIQ